MKKKFSYVANHAMDNASAFQKAGQLFEGQVSVDSDGEDDVVVDPSEEETWGVITGALEILVTEGIFCIRCAAHSLQLVCHPCVVTLSFGMVPQVLKDFEKGIATVTSAVELIKRLLEEHAGTPERASKFINAQVALGLEGKHLIRIGQTRFVRRS